MGDFEKGTGGTQDYEPTEAEEVLGSMPDFGEFMKNNDSLDSAKILQVYEIFTYTNDNKDRQNAERAINEALRKNGKTVFENLCDEINNSYIKSNDKGDEDFGAWSVASAMISASCIEKIEDSEDKEIGRAEALIFENKALQKIAHPDIYPRLVYDGQVLERVASRYKKLREDGEVNQDFDAYLKSLSEGYGLMAHSIQIGGDGHIAPEQLAEWKAINRIIKNCHYLKMDQQSEKDGNYRIPGILEEQVNSYVESENQPNSVVSSDEHPKTTKAAEEGLYQPVNTEAKDKKVDSEVGANNEPKESRFASLEAMADDFDPDKARKPQEAERNEKNVDADSNSGEIQEQLGEQIRQTIESVRQYLDSAESLIQFMSSSKISPTVEELKKITQNMLVLSNQTSAKIDRRAKDEEFLGLLYEYFQMKISVMLNEGVSIAEGIHKANRPLLHSKETLDFLRNDDQLITLFGNMKQALVEN